MNEHDRIQQLIAKEMHGVLGQMMFIISKDGEYEFDELNDLAETLTNIALRLRPD